MRTTLAVALLLLPAVCCTAPDRSLRTLEDEGYTDVQIQGWDAFGCGHDDDFSTAFTATNPRGRKVRGTVCCGVLKSCTVRF